MTLQNDPHGLILTLIAVGTVFTCLIVLFVVYTLLGKYFTRGAKKTQTKTVAVPESNSADEQTAAAIAIALQLYIQEHSKPMVITIDNSQPSAWRDSSRIFRTNLNR